MHPTNTRKPAFPTPIRRLLSCSVAAAALAIAAAPAQAISFSQGDATLDINGTVNGFYSHRSEEAGGLKTTDSALTNGLLPGWINFVFTTKVEGLDIKAHVGFAPRHQRQVGRRRPAERSELRRWHRLRQPLHPDRHP